MANLNIAKMVCDREGTHNYKPWKRNHETGEVEAKQCSRCGKIKWTH